MATKLADQDMAEFLRGRLRRIELDQNRARTNRSFTAVKDFERQLLAVKEKLTALEKPAAPEMDEQEAYELLVSTLAGMDPIDRAALLRDVDARTGLRVVG